MDKARSISCSWFWKAGLRAHIVAVLVTATLLPSWRTSADSEVRQPPPSESQPAAPGRFSQTFDEALQAYEESRFKTAHDLWLSIAEQGDLAAMRNLGLMLHRGLGVEANAEDAALWYARAAGFGLVGAQVNLGEMYHKGDGVPQDFKLAAQWYARAARAGHAHAQYKLARMIEAGETSAGNFELARKLYGWAIDAGHSGGLEGFRQLDARAGPLTSGTGQNRGNASIDLQHSSSRKTVPGAGDPVNAATPSSTEAAQVALQKARDQFTSGERGSAVSAWRQLALRSNSEAAYRLGLALLQGQGVMENRAEALHWLDIAATGGHEGAANLLLTIKQTPPKDL